MFKEKHIVGYKTESGYFCSKCFEPRREKVEKVITKHDLRVFYFICDHCGNKICMKEEDSSVRRRGIIYTGLFPFPEEPRNTILHFVIDQPIDSPDPHQSNPFFE